MIHGAGRLLWSRSSQILKVHRKDVATSEDGGKAAEVSGDSGKEVGASEDSDQDVQRK